MGGWGVVEVSGESPIILRRRLRIALKVLRGARGLSQEAVAAALDWKASKLRRIEAGDSNITVIDLRALLGHYGVVDLEQIEELTRTARYARRQWYSEFSDILSPEWLEYLQYEGAAAVVRSFEPSVVPGLLQTEEYATALLRLRPVEPDTPVIIERRIQARMERQGLLTRAGAPKAFFILDEAVLHRHVGGRESMIRQLENLCRMGDLGNVEIRVIPFRRGEHLGLWGGFMVLEFPAPEDDDLAFLEYQLGDLLIDGGSDKVAPYVEKFWSLQDFSASTEESRAMIEHILAELRA